MGRRRRSPADLEQEASLHGLLTGDEVGLHQQHVLAELLEEATTLQKVSRRAGEIRTNLTGEAPPLCEG